MSSLVVWRLCAANYAPTAYAGEGARLYGGRWSPRGVALIYTAESRALAALEVLANAKDSGDLSHLTWTLIPAELPTDAIERPARFPENWRQFPHPAETQALGGAWAKEKRSVALRVPSAVVPGEFNYLVNPLHADFKRVKLGKPEPFTFDPRIAS